MLVAGVDSSTQSCKVVLCDADDGTIVGRAARLGAGRDHGPAGLASAERADLLGTGSAPGEGTACGLARRHCRLAGPGGQLTYTAAGGAERPGRIAITIRHRNWSPTPFLESFRNLDRVCPADIACVARPSELIGKSGRK